MDQAYFLDEIGIERWVHRPKSRSSQVFIFWVSNDNSQARVLYEQMMSVISPSQANMCLIETPESLYQKVTSMHPKAILVMGDLALDVEKLEDTPQIRCLSPQQLLENPELKREAYQALLTFKQLLM